MIRCAPRLLGPRGHGTFLSDETVRQPFLRFCAAGEAQPDVLVGEPGDLETSLNLTHK